MSIKRVILKTVLLRMASSFVMSCAQASNSNIAAELENLVA